AAVGVAREPADDGALTPAPPPVAPKRTAGSRRTAAKPTPAPPRAALAATPEPPPVAPDAPPEGEGGDGPTPLAALGPPSRQVAEGWELPDLLVVDGGRGQLNVALTAARDLGLHDLPVVGLAKERVTIGGEELVDRVYVPGQKNGIPLRPQSAALFFL